MKQYTTKDFAFLDSQRHMLKYGGAVNYGILSATVEVLGPLDLADSYLRQLYLDGTISKELFIAKMNELLEHGYRFLESAVNKPELD